MENGKMNAMVNINVFFFHSRMRILHGFFDSKHALSRKESETFLKMLFTFYTFSKWIVHREQPTVCV